MEAKELQSDDIESTPAIELLEKGVELRRIETIDASKIDLEDYIVDETHMLNLADSMEEIGQISPLLVRARLERKKIIYDVIDGFHRAAALKHLNETEAMAVVMYGCSDEKLNDLRVLAVNSVSSVQFPRVVSWMFNSYQQSKWASKYNLSLGQLLSITAQDSSGKKLGLKPEEADEAKNWAREKTKRWRRSLESIWQIIISVEHADPELVMKVRSGRGGGKDGKGVFNEARFKAMAINLPDNYPLQNRMYEAIIEHDLVASEIETVAKAILISRENPETLDIISHNPRDLDVMQMILKIKMGFKRGKIVSFEERLDTTSEEQELIPELYEGAIETTEDKLLLGEDESAQLKTTIKQTNSTEPKQQDQKIKRGSKSSGSSYPRSEGIGRYDLDMDRPKDELISIIDDQKKLLELYEKRGGGSRAAWWKKLSTISQEEKQILNLTKKGFTNIQISNELGITENIVQQMKQSAIAKYRELLQGRLDDEALWIL